MENVMQDRITKREARTIFSEMVYEGCEILRWMEYVDSLYKDGVISKYQKYTWKREKTVASEPTIL
ncbi:hypothetical protein VPHD479_0039 [Vibrio phage D479]